MTETMRGEAGVRAVTYGAFLRGLINDPKGVSAPTPSSPALAEAIAAQVDPARSGLVVELGPGTGAVTAALIRHLGAARIIAIERDAHFARLLKQNFHGLDVRCGDALAFEEFLPADADVAAVVSGVPLLHLPQSARRSLLARAQGRQGRGGLFIQLSYSWRPPVAPLAGMSLAKRAVWRNFPPAHVWTYRAA